MNFHPAAQLLPMMNADELAMLKQDIEAHGQKVPAITFEGKLIDGRNRFQACQELGKKLETVEWHKNGQSPEEFVISQNVHRRHLTVGQRAAIAVKFKEIYHNTIASHRTRLGHNKFTKKSELLGRGLLASEAAGKLFGISTSAVDKAFTILKKDSRIFKGVSEGKVTVNRAYCQVMGRSAIVKPGITPRKVYTDGEANAVATAMSKEGYILELRRVMDGWLGHFFGNGIRPWSDMDWTKHDAKSFKDTITNAAHAVHESSFGG